MEQPPPPIPRRPEQISEVEGLQSASSVAELLPILSANPPALSGHGDVPVRLWFRGQANIDWPLVPAVGRRRFVDAASGFDDLDPRSSLRPFERYVFSAFEERSRALFPAHLSRVDRYLLAQHHGLPTRLLDWTTNPLVALFFAAFDRTPAEQEQDGALFFFGHEYGSWFAPALHQLDPQLAAVVDAILSPGDLAFREIRTVRPSASPMRVSPQFAGFTFHGSPDDGDDCTPVNVRAFPINVDNASSHVIRVPGRAKRAILRELRLLGVTREQLFPDIEGVARGILDEFFY